MCAYLHFWENIENDEKSEGIGAMYAMKRVRNNLFHGVKFIIPKDRNRTLNLSSVQEWCSVCALRRARKYALSTAIQTVVSEES